MKSNTKYLLTIGQLADKVDISTSAVRYYEEVGLIDDPIRISGQRRYTKDDVVHLRRIVNARNLGFSISELQLLFNEYSDATPSEAWRQIALDKLPELDEIIRQAQQMKQVLNFGLECACDTITECFNEADFGCGSCTCDSVCEACA